MQNEELDKLLGNILKKADEDDEILNLEMLISEIKMNVFSLVEKSLATHSMINILCSKSLSPSEQNKAYATSVQMRKASYLIGEAVEQIMRKMLIG